MNGTLLGAALAAFTLALFVSAMAMPAAASLGRRFGMTVSPRLFGRAEHSVSYLGGVALALGVVPAIVILAGIDERVAAILAGALALLVFGLADDRVPGPGLHPAFRLVIETLVAYLVWASGLRPVLTGRPVADALLVIFCLVAATNALNLLDNMDGVAGCTGAGLAVGLLAVAIIEGQYLLAVLAAAVTGSCLSFLRHNLSDARLYLGNGGSLFLGFVVAASALQLDLPFGTPWGFVGLLVVLAIPAMDTSVVILSRLFAGRPVFQGGVDHLSHRLVRLGLTTRAAALTHGAGCALAAMGVLLSLELEKALPLVVVLAIFGGCGLAILRLSMYEAAPEPARLNGSGQWDAAELAPRYASVKGRRGSDS